MRRSYCSIGTGATVAKAHFSCGGQGPALSGIALDPDVMGILVAITAPLIWGILHFSNREDSADAVIGNDSVARF